MRLFMIGLFAIVLSNLSFAAQEIDTKKCTCEDDVTDVYWLEVSNYDND